MSNVTIVNDAATCVHLNRVRAADTIPADFIRHARQLGTHLALAAVADMPTREIEVVTPLGMAQGREPGMPIVLVPVLRAGLGLLPGIQEALPTATVGMIGLERDADTLQPREYYAKLPPLDGAFVLVLEPMLATGGSAAAAVTRLAQQGPAQITVVGVVATDVAIEAISAAADDVRIVTAAVDPELNDLGYIFPGLGDFGDRLFGTPH